MPDDQNLNTQADQMIGIEIAGCKILEKIGQGAMGAVYKAKQMLLNRYVAIKVLSPKMVTDEVIARFRREAQYVAQLEHPNIVQVNDLLIDEENRQYFIIMQYVEGGTLEDILRTRGRVSVEQGIGMLMDAACGLQEAHEQGIIHRDIKPSNLMITERGVVKIADFGISRSKEGADASLTAHGHLIGTPLFMSPQQCQGEDADARSDMYALGITFYYAFTGVLPVTGDNLFEIINKHMHQRIEDPRKYNPEIPLELAQILLKMVEKRSADRFQSMGELIATLEKLGAPSKSRSAPVVSENMVTCPQCGKKNPSNGVFTCEKCRKPNLCLAHYDEEARSCSKCKLEAEGTLHVEKKLGHQTVSLPTFPPVQGEGPIDFSQLAKVFQYLYAFTPLGTIFFQTNQEEKAFYFHQNGITCLNLSLDLDSILVEHGYISQEQLADLQELRQQTGKTTEALLTERGLIEETQISAILQSQVESNLIEMLLQEEGSYKFVAGSDPEFLLKSNAAITNIDINPSLVLLKCAGVCETLQFINIKGTLLFTHQSGEQRGVYLEDNLVSVFSSQGNEVVNTFQLLLQSNKLTPPQFEACMAKLQEGVHDYQEIFSYLNPDLTEEDVSLATMELLAQFFNEVFSWQGELKSIQFIQGGALEDLSPSGGSYPASIDFGQFFVNTALTISNWSCIHNGVFQLKRIFDLNTKNPSQEVFSLLFQRYPFEQILSYTNLPPVEMALFLALSCRGELLSLLELLEYLRQFYQKTNQDSKIQQIRLVISNLVERKFYSSYQHLTPPPTYGAGTGYGTYNATQTPLPVDYNQGQNVFSAEAIEGSQFFSQQEHNNYNSSQMGTMPSIPQNDLTQAAESVDEWLFDPSNLLANVQYKANLLKEIDRNPKNIEAHQKLLDFFQKSNQDTESYEMAIKLARLYIKNSMLEPLEQLCLAYLHKDQDLFLRNTLINTYLDLNRKEDAVNVYRDILEQLEKPSEEVLLEYYNKILRIDPTLNDVREAKEKILLARQKREKIAFFIKAGSAVCLFVVFLLILFVYKQVSEARAFLIQVQALRPEQDIENLPQAKRLLKEKILDGYPSFYPPTKEAQELYQKLEQLDERYQKHKAEKIKSAEEYSKGLQKKWKEKLEPNLILTKEEIQEYNTNIKELARLMGGKDARDYEEIRSIYEPLYQNLIKGMSDWALGIANTYKTQSVSLKKIWDDLINKSSSDLNAFAQLAEEFNSFIDRLKTFQELLGIFESSSLPVVKTVSDTLRQLREGAERILKEIWPKIIRKHEADLDKLKIEFDRKFFDLTETKKFYDERETERKVVEDVLANIQSFSEKNNLPMTISKNTHEKYEQELKNWQKLESKAAEVIGAQTILYKKALEELKEPNLELIAKNALKTYVREVTEKILSNQEFRWTKNIKNVRLPLFFKFISNEETQKNVDIYEIKQEGGPQEKLGSLPFFIEYEPIFLENYMLDLSKLPTLFLGNGRELLLNSRGFQILPLNIENDVLFIQEKELKIPLEIALNIVRTPLWTITLPMVKTPEKEEEPGVLEVPPLLDEKNAVAYFVTRSGCIYAYSYKNLKNAPELLWSKKFGTSITGFRTRPLLYQDKLYLGTTDGTIYALDSNNRGPENRSKKRFNDEIKSIISPLVPFKNNLFFVSQMGLFMVDTDLEKPVRIHELSPGTSMDNYELLPISYQGKSYLVVLNNKKEARQSSSELVILDLENPEKVLKRVPLSSRVSCSTCPIFYEDSLYIGDDSGTLWQVDLNTWTTQSKIAKNQVISTSPLIFNSKVEQLLLYGTSRSLIAHDLKSGMNPLANPELFVGPKNICSELVSFQNVLYFGAENNVVYALDLNKLQESNATLWKFDLKQKHSEDKLHLLQSQVVGDVKKKIIFVGAANSIVYLFETLD